MIKLGSGLVACGVALALAGCGGSASTVTTTVAETPTGTDQPTSAAPATNSPATASPTQTSPTPSPTRTAQSPRPQKAHSTPEKTKPEEKVGGTPFLAAAGRGFGAFHAYVSKPLRERQLSGGKASKTVRIAAAAAAYAAREAAAAGAAASREAAIRQLAVPLARAAANLQGIGEALAKGGLPEAQVVQARVEVNAISVEALNAGQPIQEITPAPNAL
jgi:hypothetical protein